MTRQSLRPGMGDDGDLQRGQHRVGQPIAKVLDGGQLDMRYHHLNDKGELMLGKCAPTPERLPDGRLSAVKFSPLGMG